MDQGYKDTVDGWLKKLKDFPHDVTAENSEWFRGILQKAHLKDVVLTVEFYSDPSAIECSMSLDTRGHEFVAEGPYFMFSLDLERGPILDVLNRADQDIIARMESWAKRHKVQFSILR